MKLSAPVHRLKRLAKELSRSNKMPLHAALDRIAQGEGFASWSLLASRLAAQGLSIDLLAQLVLLSQSDRSYEPGASVVPRFGQVRLPNPLDLRLFDKASILHAGVVGVLAIS
jgi:hypothetical protein